MSEPLTFMMGKFAAVLPADRRYARNHMWCMPADGALRFGFTTYAVRLMQDVYFLDWEVNAGDPLALKQKIGHIETSKAMSDLFAPIEGTLVRFNPELLNDPSAINVDNYDKGWLFEMTGSDADVMNVQEYYDFLDANWEKTQNMLKGHMQTTMARHRLTVVLSQAQGKHPVKRALEESVVAALIMEPGLEVSVVPFLYDLGADHTGRLFLDSVRGDMVLLSWLFPRAAYWVLDRDGIKGKWGETQLKPPADDDDEEAGEPEPPRGIGAVDVPDRHIYCLDLRDFNQHDPYVSEIQRIAEECRVRREEKERQRVPPEPAIVQLGLKPAFAPEQLLQTPGRRWYPVIDYSRCTNCMECIDFCLFGVYGVDGQERILVENQDNCKKGCPACSRVCPEQAIMFPDYKTPAIAGAPVGAIGNLKIDLTKLFGGADKDPLAQAVAERDRELVADGRQAVGVSVGLPKRQDNAASKPKDDLDKLMDSLDALEL